VQGLVGERRVPHSTADDRCACLSRQLMCACLPAAKPQRAARLVVRAEEAAAPAAPKAAAKKEVGPKRGSQVRCRSIAAAACSRSSNAHWRSQQACWLHPTLNTRLPCCCRSRSCGQSRTGTTRPARSCLLTRCALVLRCWLRGCCFQLLLNSSSPTALRSPMTATGAGPQSWLTPFSRAAAPPPPPHAERHPVPRGREV
jgi:hypothetical protein